LALPSKGKNSYFLSNDQRKTLRNRRQNPTIEIRQIKPSGVIFTLITTMSRAFSTSAKAFLKFVWDGMSKETKWEEAGRKVIENSSKTPKDRNSKSQVRK